MEKEILVNFLEILFINSFTTSSAKFNKFDIPSKVTASPSYARSRVVMQINIKNEIWKLSKWKMFYKDSVVSPFYLNLLDITYFFSLF